MDRRMAVIARRWHQGILEETSWGTCMLMSWHRNSTRAGYSQWRVPLSYAATASHSPAGLKGM